MKLVHDLSLIYMIRNSLLFRMRKIRHLIFVSLLASLSSCNSDVFQEHEIGSNLIDQSTSVILIDTFTVNSSTIKLDSVSTSNFQNVLWGKYNDPYLGSVSSDFYGEVELEKSFALRKIKEVTKVFVKFDSLVFIAYHQERQQSNNRVLEYYYGDTLAQQKISIHRVTEDLTLPKNKNFYRAHDMLSYDLESIGEKVFIPEYYKNSKFDKLKDQDPQEEKGGLRIRMDDAIGLDIIKKVNASDEIVLDKVKWLEYFEGIVLKADKNNTAMFSFQTGTKMKMRVYYSDIDFEQANISRIFDFPINKKGTSFSNYKSDFISAEHAYVKKIGEIKSIKKDVSSVETNNLTYVQGGVGLVTKLNIPYIENLNRLGLTGGALKAELIFSPKEESYDDEIYRLPNLPFELYTTDKNNKFKEGVVNPRTNKTVTSTYFRNSQHPDKSYYTFDVTNRINKILSSGQTYDDALLITFPIDNIGNSMDRIVIDSDPNSDMRVKLKVTYVVQK